MESFNRYLDKIKAEESLKDNTKIFLQDKLAEIATEAKEFKSLSKCNFFNWAPKKRTALLGTIASVIIVMSGYLIYQTPVAYVSMDINPSVEIELNTLDRVVGINMLNEESVKMMEDESILNLKSEKAIEVLIGKACDHGYVNSDGSSVVSIISITGSDKRSMKLNQKLSDRIQLSLNRRNAFAAAYSATSGIESRAQAKKMGVSIGKYNLIKALENIDPSIKREDYRYAKISEIIAKADELADKNEHPDRLDEATRGMIERVRAISAQVNRNREKARKQRPNNNPRQGENPNKPPGLAERDVFEKININTLLDFNQFTI